MSEIKAIARLFKKHEHLVKYVVIGATAAALDLAIFMFLFNIMEATALQAHSVSVPTSVVFSFFANARHNFGTTDLWMLRMAIFAVVCTIGYAVGYFVIAIAVSSGFGANIGKILSLPMVFLTQYFLNSRITFRKFADHNT
jgi:putative flippase GtrA